MSKEEHHDFDPLTGRARKVTRWLERPDYWRNHHYRGSFTTRPTDAEAA